MNALGKFFQGLVGPAIAIALLIGWGVYKVVNNSPAPPAASVASPQADAQKLVREALARAQSTPRPTPAPTATPLPAGWPKVIVRRSWASVDNIRGQTSHEAWSVEQMENYRQYYRPDSGASETMRFSSEKFYSPAEIVNFAFQHGIVVNGYTARQGAAIVPQRR